MKAINVAKLLEISCAVSSERDGDALLETILTAAMDFAECDGGTLYIRNGEELAFKLVITRSNSTRLGGKYGGIPLCPVPITRANVCACAVLDGKLINLPDVYQSDCYDFSGPRDYDARTGYKTVSMLVTPMENDRGQIIGAMQLINAQNHQGTIIPFPAACEQTVLAMSSLAAISLTNMNYAEEVRSLLDSLVGVLSTVIDAHTPYNANHTRNMARCTERFLDWLDCQGQGWNFTESEKRQFLLSVWLHDVGKLITPIEIMDKSTRLGGALEQVQNRLSRIRLLGRIEALESGGCCDALLHDIAAAWELIARMNTATMVDDSQISAIQALGMRTYIEEDGTIAHWLTKDECVALAIRRGTLTESERRIMEAHVTMTARILDEVKFNGEYARTAEWAGAHHELLDGSGYPSGLAGDAICREVRLLTILDIFDALTAQDRPYKSPLLAEKAFEVLHEMADQGKLDSTILALFEKSRAWQAPN